MHFAASRRRVTHWLVTGGATLAAFAGGPLAGQPDSPRAAPHPPIPVRFRLAQPAFVTLVIERPLPAASEGAGARSQRVKNLVSNTWYPAGEHTVWWDGRDETNARLISIPGQGSYYRIHGALVSPGEYRVRGLARQAVAPKYQFSVYSGGQSPPWQTKSGREGWLADLWKKPGATQIYFSGPATTPGSWFRFESEEWQLWADFDAIQRVRFVREPQHDDPEREALSIRLVGANDRPWLGCSFEGLYDEQKRPVPARFARWEALRAKYGGCDELRVKNGRLVCPA